jgi:hypothetical protein
VAVSAHSCGGRARAAYAGVFFVVAALELYGTSIGAWHWTRTLPGLGITDGNPPSGAASGYVWFDVMAMLVAPTPRLRGRQAQAKASDPAQTRGAQAGRCVGGRRELAAVEEAPRGRRFGHLLSRPDANLARLNERPASRGLRGRGAGRRKRGSLGHSGPRLPRVPRLSAPAPGCPCGPRMQRWPISLLTGHARCCSSPTAVTPAWLLLRWPSGPAVGRLCANACGRNRSSAAVAIGSGRARSEGAPFRSCGPRLVGSETIAAVMLLAARGGCTSTVAMCVLCCQSMSGSGRDPC